MKIKTCRKEAKESRYWLSLIQVKSEEATLERQALIDEATELLKIFSTIIEKVK